MKNKSTIISINIKIIDLNRHPNIIVTPHFSYVKENPSNLHKS